MGRCRAPHESARNAEGTPGCGIAGGAARRTPGTPPGAPPVPAGPGCRRPACGARAGRAAAAARAGPVRTPTAGTRAHTHRTGSPAPRPAPCRAAAARAAGCSMRSYVHGRATVSPIRAQRRLYPSHSARVRAGRLGTSRPRARTGHLACPGLPYLVVPSPSSTTVPSAARRCRCGGLSSSHGDRTV